MEMQSTGMPSVEMQSVGIQINQNQTIGDLLLFQAIRPSTRSNLEWKYLSAGAESLL